MSLDHTKLSFPIFDIFIHSALLPLININFAYHFDFIYKFFTNLVVIINHGLM